MTRVLVLLAVPGLAAAQGFTDHTAAAGLVAPHFPAYAATTTYAAGGAVGDFDRDGSQDLFVALGGGLPDRLFLNRGDGTFVDVSAAWGVAVAHRGTGAAVGDVDGDGFLDLFVTSLGPTAGDAAGHHRLYLNQGGAGFVDVAAAWGVASTGAADGFGAAFGDLDLDGDLDLAVAGWLTGANRLFRNDGGRFTDVTAGLPGVQAVAGFTPRFADMDGDRWPELVLIGDFGTTRYYRNDRGTLVDETLASGVGLDGSEMGATIADLDEDGRLDLYVTTIGTNNLYANRGPHTYLNFAGVAGVVQTGWGWGTVALDHDHDTRPDLFATSQGGRQYAFRNVAARPRQLAFVEEGLALGLGATVSGRGLSHLDLEGDGDQDLVIFPFGDDLVLYRNDLPAGPTTHWLRVFLDRGDRRRVAPDGVGSRVEVRLGDRRLVRYLDAGGFLAPSELSAHFGLGDHAIVDELRVWWTDGSVTRLVDVPADQTLVLAPRGLVPAGDGPELLRVDGATGGAERRVEVAAGQPFDVSLDAGPAGPTPTRGAIYGLRGVPEADHAWTDPRVRGELAFPPCRDQPGNPRLFTVASSLGGDPCVPLAPMTGPPARLTLVAPRRTGQLTLQAVVETTIGGVPTWVATNGVIVDVR